MRCLNMTRNRVSMAFYWSPLAQDFIFVTFVLSGLPQSGNPDLARSVKDKEFETVITGSKYSGGTGTIVAPPEYPHGYYNPDSTSYIFILENVATEGSVELIIEEFNIHERSWITTRNSKYGGYIGRVLGRYNYDNPPPHVIFTPTCCLRVEFQTGCCSEGDPRFAGFKATYKFVTNPGRGRRVSCEGEKVYNQLCNGECILGIYDCPCPQYGQFKCANGVCLTAGRVCDGRDDCGDMSDEELCSYIAGRTEYEGMGSMYGFSVVISTVMSIVCTAFVLVFSIRCVENCRSRKLKRVLTAERRNISGTAINHNPTCSRKEVSTPPSTSLARIFPASKPRATMAVLSVGHTPSVSVKPLPQLGQCDVISSHDVVYDSDSSHCESGFHGDDEGCSSASSETDNGQKNSSIDNRLSDVQDQGLKQSNVHKGEKKDNVPWTERTKQVEEKSVIV